MDLKALPDIAGTIDKIMKNKKGKGVRRLTGLVEAYLNVAKQAEEDGELTDSERVLLNSMAEAIANQCAKLSS